MGGLLLAADVGMARLVIRPNFGVGKEVQKLKKNFERPRMIAPSLNEGELLESRAEGFDRTEKASEEFGRGFSVDEGEGAQVSKEAVVDQREEETEILIMVWSAMTPTAAIVASR